MLDNEVGNRKEERVDRTAGWHFLDFEMPLSSAYWYGKHRKAQWDTILEWHFFHQD